MCEIPTAALRELGVLNISNSYHLLRLNIQDTKLNSRGLSMLMIQNNSLLMSIN